MHICYSRSELLLLSEYSRGNDRIGSLAEKMRISITQAYRIVETLRKKGVLSLDSGTISVENKTHLILLLNILRNYRDAYIPLSDSGLEILLTMDEPSTMKEISIVTGLNLSTISRKIKQMSALSMVVKQGSKYSLNEKIWKELPELCSETKAYEDNTDLRVPSGCRLYHSDKDLAVFSSPSELRFKATAFSVFGLYGIKLLSGLRYYTTGEDDVTLEEAFLHSLWIASKDGDWRLKMLSLIFYAKNRELLQDVHHPMRDEMDRILAGDVVSGWIPTREMQERADMYGVKLID